VAAERAAAERQAAERAAREAAEQAAAEREVASREAAERAIAAAVAKRVKRQAAEAAQRAVAELEAAEAAGRAGLISELAPGTSLDDAIAAYEATLEDAPEGHAAIAAAAPPAEPLAPPEPTAIDRPRDRKTRDGQTPDSTQLTLIADDEQAVALAEPAPASPASPAGVAPSTPGPAAGPIAEPLQAEAQPAAPRVVPAPGAGPTRPAEDAGLRPAAHAAGLRARPDGEPDAGAAPWRVVAPESDPSATPPLAAGSRPQIVFGGIAIRGATRTGVGVQPPRPAQNAGPVPCAKCGLSLSSTARFCRRCGTRQG
jgi:hypothetical protein